MLTVKVMSPGGGEEIHCGLSVGFNPDQQSITVSGMDQNIFLKEGEIAYVMNSNGNTISRYKRSIATVHSTKARVRYTGSGEVIWEAPPGLGRPV